MKKFNVENLEVTSGEFNLDFINLSTSWINVENVRYYDKDITDSRLLEHIEELQNKVKENGKYILDTLTYSAVKFLAEDEYNIYHAEELGVICDERSEVLTDEKIEDLESYANSVNLKEGYEGYSGDITKYVEEYFPALNLEEVISDYELFEGIMLDGEGGFTYTPEGNTDIWEGDYISVSKNLFAEIKRH